MANLLGQNIGTNYKGILNLNTLNGNLSGTLQAVTDGDGNASPLQLSTTQVNVGGGTALGRLVVRGDGTNPIIDFQNLGGVSSYKIASGGSRHIYGSSEVSMYLTNQVGAESPNGVALSWYAAISSTAGYAYRMYNFNNYTYTSGTGGGLNLYMSFTAGAGSGNFRPLGIDYIINNSGAQTGTATGIFLNATETALNGMTHNLMDLGTGGGTYVSRFNVGRVHDAAFRFNSMPASNNWRPLCSISRIGTPGTASLFFGVGSGGSTASAFIASNNDELYLGTDASNTFTTNIVLKANAVGFVGFGGLTNSFPALKRSSAALDVRLADDTDFANLGAKEISANVGFFAPNSTEVRGNYIRGRSSTYMNFSSGTPGVVIDSSSASSASASAILQADSTTKGFLPPRMTTAERDLIASPATGLVIYNTSTNVLNFYNGSVWGAV